MLEGFKAILQRFRSRSSGEVLDVKLWPVPDGSKTGHVSFQEGTDIARVLAKLDNRRVDGALASRWPS